MSEDEVKISKNGVVLSMKKLSYPRSGESRLSYIEEDSQRAQSNLTFTQLTGGGGGTAYKPPSMTYLPFFPIRV